MTNHRLPLTRFFYNSQIYLKFIHAARLWKFQISIHSSEQFQTNFLHVFLQAGAEDGLKRLRPKCMNKQQPCISVSFLSGQKFVHRLRIEGVFLEMLVPLSQSVTNIQNPKIILQK